MGTFFGILIIAAAILLVMLLEYGLRRVGDKAVDSVRNARIRSRNEAAPPQPQRLADRYAQSQQSSNAPRT